MTVNFSMSCHQNAGQNHSLLIENISFKNVIFKCLRITETNKNFIRKKYKAD